MLYARYGLVEDYIKSTISRQLINAIEVNISWICGYESIDYIINSASGLNAYEHINRDLSLYSFINPYC